MVTALDYRINESLLLRPAGEILTQEGEQIGVVKLDGGSLPNAGLGQPIGKSQFEEIATVKFQAKEQLGESGLKVEDMRQLAAADGVDVLVGGNFVKGFEITPGKSPEIMILDSSGDGGDQSIHFNTQLSSKSVDYVRPNNQTTASGLKLKIQEKAPLTSQELKSTRQMSQLILRIKTISVQPGQTEKIKLSYTPSEAGEQFSHDDGLIIMSNAINNPETKIALQGKSTFNADISYDGVVAFGDLGPLNAAWGTDDANSDINGDGTVSFGDLGPLNVEWGKEII